MKKVALILFFLLTSIIGFSQNQSVSPTNQTIIRLTIIKDNKILMRETGYGWMTPAIYFKGKQNVHEILDSLSGVYGIKISPPKLNGLFTYKYEFKPTADFRQLYTAKYESGDLKLIVGKEKICWMPIEEALLKLGSTVKSLEGMTKQVLEYPETIWGGSFVIDKDANWKLTSRVEENFYPLMKNNK
ncbi:MAG: hypothetical protein V3V33_11820 [Candidatus Lokiarchaeia archaeon]